MLSAPVRLDLKIMYNCRTLIREMLDIWPAVPITIWASRLRGEIEENAIAALEHRGHVSQISIYDNSNHAL